MDNTNSLRILFKGFGHAVRRGESASLKFNISISHRAILKQVQDDEDIAMV